MHNGGSSPKFFRSQNNILKIYIFSIIVTNSIKMNT